MKSFFKSIFQVKSKQTQKYLKSCEHNYKYYQKTWLCELIRTLPSHSILKVSVHEFRGSYQRQICVWGKGIKEMLAEPLFIIKSCKISLGVKNTSFHLVLPQHHHCLLYAPPPPKQPPRRNYLFNFRYKISKSTYTQTLWKCQWCCSLLSS